MDLLCVLVSVVRREESEVFRALREGESAMPSPSIVLLGTLQKVRLAAAYSPFLSIACKF